MSADRERYTSIFDDEEVMDDSKYIDVLWEGATLLIDTIGGLAFAGVMYMVYHAVVG